MSLLRLQVAPFLREIAVTKKKDYSKLQHLITTRPDMTMACLGQAIGVSKERVRQIIQKKNLPYRSKHNPNILLIWPCLQCGKEIKRMSTFIPRYKSVLCGDCSTGRGRFCKAGHKDPLRNKRGQCLLCRAAYRNHIVETKPCVVCGRMRNITYGLDKLSKSVGYPNECCKQCYYARGKAAK